MPPSAAKILIVDDHPAVREALTIRIATTPDLVVCGEAEDEVEAVKLTRGLKPDVVIIDLGLKSGDGINLIKRIKSKFKGVRMLVWSMQSEGDFAERAIRAGASGYITKEHATDRIVDALRQVLSGQIYLSPEFSNRLIKDLTQDAGGARRSVVADLSDRELEVLRLIGRGHPRAEIARRMHLSPKTISTYRDRIRNRLGLTNGSDLNRFAAQWLLENS
jgi:DNA-binding NarL/FixJ family response regulator